MTPFDFHLQTARGFLQLEQPLAAHEELERIAPELRHLSEVLALKVTIFQWLHQWALLEVCAKELSIRHSDEPAWLVFLAEATRHVHSPERAVALLRAAVARFPTSAAPHYGLACHAAQLGALPSARNHLKEAIGLDPAYGEIARQDPELAPLRAAD